MKIAFVHPSYPGVVDGTGAAFSATKIVEGLRDNGHTVTVYCMNSPDSESCIDGVSTKDLSSGLNPHSRLSLDQNIRSRMDEFEAFDLVHNYLMATVAASQTIQEQTGTPVVQTLNAYGAVCPKNDLMYADSDKCTSRSVTRCLECIAKTNIQYPIKKTAARSIFHLGNLYLIEKALPVDGTIDAFHALSPAVARQYSGFGFDPERIHTIPNIADEKFDMEDQAEGNTKLLFVGFFHKHKGVDRLVPVFEEYVRDYDDSAILTIVGDGPFKEELEQSVNSSFVSDQIELRGRIPNDELPDVYARHTAFLYPARWDEPFGRIFLEAMATGTPVVATNTGSVKNIIDGAGIVVDSENELPATLNSIVSNRGKYITEIDLDQYRMDNVIPQFERVYESIVPS